MSDPNTHEITAHGHPSIRFSCSCGSEIHPDTSSAEATQASMLPWLQVHAAKHLRPDLRITSSVRENLVPTHEGICDRTGRGVALVYLDGGYRTPAEAQARLSGFTREEDIYSNVRPLRAV